MAEYATYFVACRWSESGKAKTIDSEDWAERVANVTNGKAADGWRLVQTVPRVGASVATHSVNPTDDMAYAVPHTSGVLLIFERE